MNILIIGLGRFGTNLALKYTEKNNDVMIVDKDEDLVHEVLEKYDRKKNTQGRMHGKWTDCTKMENLSALSVNTYDICFVCIGSDELSSILVTNLLAHPETDGATESSRARFIISKASSDMHEKLLLRNGADKVVFPERDYANSYAATARYSAMIGRSSDNSEAIFEELVELKFNHAIFRIPVADEWVGKSLKECNTRKIGINILAIYREEEGKKERPQAPVPDFVFSENDELIVFGLDKNIKILLDKYNKHSKGAKK